MLSDESEPPQETVKPQAAGRTGPHHKKVPVYVVGVTGPGHQIGQEHGGDDGDPNQHRISPPVHAGMGMRYMMVQMATI